MVSATRTNRPRSFYGAIFPGQPSAIPIPAGAVLALKAYESIADDGTGRKARRARPRNLADRVEIHDRQPIRAELAQFRVADAQSLPFADAPQLSAKALITMAKGGEFQDKITGINYWYCMEIEIWF